MDELVDVYNYISMQWGGYKDRAADLAAVSLLSNTAIMMVRRAEMALQDLQRPKKSIQPMSTRFGRFYPCLCFAKPVC